MDFRILGPLEAQSGGQPLHLGGPRQRALLGYLLLHANEAVSPERLLDDLWFEPPNGGLAALQTQVSRVRKIVGARLVTSDGGYALQADESELDLLRLRGMLAAAGSASTPGERSRLLREADAIWRGEPLAGLDAPFVGAEAAALEELRIGALEERIAADLERGLHAELIPELSLLVSRYPLRERLRAQLILALYRSGRQADALVAYRDARRTLLDELGLDPSPALRDLERAILVQDESLAPPSVETSEQPALSAPRRSRMPRRRTLLLVAVCSLLLLGAGSAATVLSLRTDQAAAPAARSPRHAVAPPRSRPKVSQSRKHAKAAKPVAHRSRTSVHRTAQPTKLTVPHTPKTVTQATRVTKTTTKKKPAATPPAPQPSTTLSDDFTNPSPNLALWSNGTDGTGASWTLANGRLEMTLPADSVPGGRYTMVSVAFDSTCRLNSDFDARVDYQLIDWPAANGAIIQLAAWIFPDLNSAAARSSDQYGEKYNGNVGGSWQTLPTSDQQGSLRVTRRGGVMSTYELQGDNWIKLNSNDAHGQVMLGLQLFAPGNTWARKDVRAAFDNFSVAGPNITCQ